MNLAGTVALVTGGRRVGALLAELLAARGAAVALTYHTSRARIEEVAGTIQAAGGRAFAVAADLRDAGQAASAVEQVVAKYGRLDILVNMASTYRRTPLAGLAASDFDAMIAANLASVYHTSLAAARQMLAQPAIEPGGLNGKIVSVGDWATERPYKHYLPYLVAKGALKTLTMALAKELAPHVTVNLVQPAMIDPPPNLSAEEQSAAIAATPLKRVGQPDDANRLILYLLEGTDFATGGCYRIDGGRFLGTDE
jgi:NAD(P)-dependent dehydrogenase (short-subunit alcohol dehydrogenase family)